jgi:hypothetical protein
MNRNLVIGVVVAAVVGVGAVIYFATQGEDNGDTANNSANQSDQSGDAPLFNPTGTNGLDFVGLISGSGAEGDITFEYDKDSDSFRYLASSNGEAIETITTPDAYFAMAGGEWIKYPANTSSSFDAAEYQYDDDDLNTYQGSSIYAGTEACSTGTCHVWRHTAENTETTLLVDTETNYIVRVSAKVGEQTSVIDYEYKDVTVTPPTDFQELPAFD